MSNKNRNRSNHRGAAPKPADKLDLSQTAATAVAESDGAAEAFDPNQPIDPAVLLGNQDDGQFGEGVALPPDGAAEEVAPTSSVVPVGADEPGGGADDDHASEKTGEARGTVLIELPPLISLTADEIRGFATSHIDVQLRRGEPRKFKRLHRSLIESNVRLDGGTGPHVRTVGDVVRWLVQQLPDA